MEFGKKEITLDELKNYLWGAAVSLRGQIDASAYKDYIFPLVFFKRICDVYDEEYRGYAREAGEEFANMQMEDAPIQIPPDAHWNVVFNTTTDIGDALAEAFRKIERANPGREFDGRIIGGLEGIFGDKTIWKNKSKMPDHIIKSLLNNFNRKTLSLKACPADEMGTGYEYLIGQFADDAGHTAQEFYTNRSVVDLMAEILQLQPHESLYDPTCGSGGMLIKSLTHLKDKGLEWRDVKVFGQEINTGTSAIARMNLYLHGIHDFSVVNADTLENPAFVVGERVRQFDVVLANPPYSIKTWNREKFQNDIYGRCFLGVPPQSKADYAFIQHIIASMSQDKGRCAILLPHGVLNRLQEKDIRKNMIEADLVEGVISIGKNLFFNSPMEACILLCRNNKPTEKKNKIILIKATTFVERKNSESYLTQEHIATIKDIYLNYKEVEGLSRIIDSSDIPTDKYSISPKLYIRSIGDETDDDYEGSLQEWNENSITANKDLEKLKTMLSNGTC